MRFLNDSHGAVCVLAVAVLVIFSGCRPPTGYDLSEAVSNGDSKKVQSLLVQGVDPNNTYTSVLFIAAINDNTEMVKLLLEHGADADAKDLLKDLLGESMLCVAVEDGSTEMVKLLLEHGADADAKDWFGKPVLCVAARKGNTEMVKLLLAHGAGGQGASFTKTTALMHAIKLGDTNTANVLIENGADSAKAHALLNRRKMAEQARARAEEQRRKEWHEKKWDSVVVFIVDDFHDSDHGRSMEEIISKHYPAYKMVDTRDLSTAFKSIEMYSAISPTTRIVVNMSWGSSVYSSSLEQYFRHLTEKGFVFVAAAGNEGQCGCMYPAGYDDVIGVGSVFDLDGRFIKDPNSNYGPCVDIAAQGIVIDEISKLLGEPFIKSHGTSIAAAHVTGAIARELSRRKFLRGDEIIYNLPIGGSCDGVDVLDLSSVW